LALAAICCPKIPNAWTIFKRVALSDFGVAPPSHLYYRDGNDDILFVAFLYPKATPMPVSTSDAQPAPAPPARLPVNAFFDQVIQAVRRHEARAHRAEHLTGEPFSYDLASTASFSGLPVHLLRRLCRDTELQAVKFSGHWLLHRDEFNRLLAPEVTLRCRAARQYILVRNLQQLSALLHPHEAESTLYVLLHDLRRAIMFRQSGACHDDAEGMVWARAEWRIREGIVDADQTEESLRLIRFIILCHRRRHRRIWHGRH
jgi:hypothetical protein